MPPPPSTTAGGSNVDKMKMGAMMGGMVGLSLGFLMGGFSILRSGPGPRGAVATLAQFMGSSAATFAFFMSIGSVIRTEQKYAITAGTPVRVHAMPAPWATAYRSAMARKEKEL